MSSNQWIFYNSVRIQFGRKTRRAVVEELAGLRVLAVSTARGREQFTSDELVGPIAGNLTWVDSVTANPGITDIENTFHNYRNQSFDAVLAFGGGSAIDFGKAGSALLSPTLDSQDLRSLIAVPEKLLTHRPLPLFAVPTTAGTGSEVTPFATIWDHENKKKLSLASPSLFPKAAIVDPELTDQLPADATISSGLDALNQAFESVWNKNSTPVSLALASKAIGLALVALPALLQNLENQKARDQMAEASLLAGLGISQTKTALCHSMSYPLTAHFGVPHGLACAFTMGEVLRRSMVAMPGLFDSLARMTHHNTAQDLLGDVLTLLQDVGVSEEIKKYAGDRTHILSLVDEMWTAGRNDNFPVAVTTEDLVQIVKNSYQ